MQVFEKLALSELQSVGRRPFRRDKTTQHSQFILLAHSTQINLDRLLQIRDTAAGFTPSLGEGERCLSVGVESFNPSSCSSGRFGPGLFSGRL
jgi:hypothetical protein